MNKKPEDYLHLYLKCWGTFTRKSKSNCYQHYESGEWGLSGALLHEVLAAGHEFKPHLRPLLDMTEKEAVEYARFYHPKPLPEKYTVEVKKHESGGVHVSISNEGGGISLFPGGIHGDRPEAFRYLLYKSFDLFGLIEAGLAIDKSTMKK